MVKLMAKKSLLIIISFKALDFKGMRTFTEKFRMKNGIIEIGALKKNENLLKEVFEWEPC